MAEGVSPDFLQAVSQILEEDDNRHLGEEGLLEDNPPPGAGSGDGGTEKSVPPPKPSTPAPDAQPPATQGGARDFSKPDALPRQTVAAIQRRRAAAADQDRQNKRDKGAAICLTAAVLYASGVFVYAMWYGKLQVLEDHREAAGWIGQGLIETVRLKTWIFVKVPLQTTVLALIWLFLLWCQAKLTIWATILGGGGMSIIASVFVLLHGSAHDNQEVIVVGVLALCGAIVSGCANCGSLVPETVHVTAAFMQEARAWLTLRGARAEGQNRLSAFFDCVPLVTATLLVVLLFLEAAAVAAAIHLWGIPITSSATKITTLSTSMRFFLPGIVLTAAWGCFFVDAVHRATLSALVTGRYFVQAGAGEGDAEEKGLESEEAAQPSVAPTPLVCLHASVDRHGPALSKGSAVVTFYHFFRRIQILMEKTGTRGKRMVTELLRRFPFLVHAVYVSPHAYVLLAQRQKRTSFFAAAKEVFKLFARNPEGKVVKASLGPQLLDSGRILAASLALTALIRGVEGDAEGKGVHLLALVACVVLSISVFHHIAAVALFSFDAICVCYVQNVEQSRPAPPTRCSTQLHEAVMACLEMLPQDDFEEREKTYSADREAAHSADNL